MLTISSAFGNEVLTLNDETTIVFNEAFTLPYVSKIQQEFLDKSAKNPDKDLFLVLYTPGGSIAAGNLLFDTINALPNKVHTVTIFAASMGYNTVQNLGTRYIIPSGTLMSHRARVRGVSGQVPGEANTTLEYIGKIVEELEVIASDRVGIPLRSYQELVRDEFWTTGRSAVRTGHADKAVWLSCDASLRGTYKKEIRTMFGVFNAIFSKCPMIVFPIGVERVSGEGTVEDFNNYYLNIHERVEVRL